MMPLANIEITLRWGREVAQVVDSFYESNGSPGRARPDDLLFLAIAGETLVGCVRYCVEDETPMLRTMQVHRDYRRQGIGLSLLNRFAQYLDAQGDRNVYCLPYPHLENFYGRIGFVRVSPDHAPEFLQERLRTYDPTGTRYLCMRRP
jgi:N-acetylglutamate synthase-like GNAT family acetyltransferase